MNYQKQVYKVVSLGYKYMENCLAYNQFILNITLLLIAIL